MSEQVVIKQKTDVLGLVRRLTPSREKTLEQQKNEEYYKELTENLHDAYNEWQVSLANFETAESKEMIDYYSYRIKASQIKYDYLLKKAKEARG